MRRFITNNVSIFLGAFLLLLATPMNASHIMGGDITFTCVGPNQFSVQLKLYQDCNGSNLLSQVSEPIIISSQSCNITLNLDIDFVNNPPNPNPEDITPVCPGQTTACNGGSGAYGIEEFTYKSTFTLPANCNDWVISWDDCCRNGAITTLNGGGQALYIETALNNLNAPCNNSPNFLNDPTPFACVGENINYSHGVSEFDGDSLAFSLINCLDDANVGVNYGGGFSGTNPLTTSTGVNINPSTGAINFTPTAVEVGVICVLVQEYRNGILISEVMRDIQFRVLQCNNTLPTVSGANGTTNFDLTHCEDQDISFDVTGFDSNPGDIVSMDWNFGIPQATFTVDNSVQPPVGTFTWNTTKADAGFHIFTVNMTDDACPIIGVNIFTFSITILDVPDVDPGDYQSMCGDMDSVTIATNVNAADQSYAWTPIAGLVNPMAATTLAAPSVTTTYTITKTFTNGCVEADSVTIEVVPDVNMPALNDVSICLGDSIQLDVTIPVTLNPQTFTENTSQPIPDLDTLFVPLNISGVSPANILSPDLIESICLNIDHPADSDLELWLIAPSGQTLALSLVNGGFGNNYTNTCFTQNAAASITTGSPPFTGDFLPQQGNFNSLVGESSNATWTLMIIDIGNGFTGTYNNWSMTFADPSVITYAWTPTDSLSCADCSDPFAGPDVTTTYTVVATNFFGCTDTQSVTIDIISTIAAPIITCCATTPTSLTYCWDTIPGAVSYEVSLDGGATWISPNNSDFSHQITGLLLGQSVTIDVRGISNCPGVAPSASKTCITSPCSLTASLAGQNNVSCNGGNDGIATISDMGGNAPITYTFPGQIAQTSNIITGISAGSYVVTVTDVFGCVANVNVTITEPTALAVTPSSTGVNCNGENNGTATITPTGGTIGGGYTYLWDANAANQTTQTATNLTANTYSVTVTDANTCTIVGSVIVTEPTAIVLDSMKVDVSCNGAADGQTTVTVTGGTIGTGYTYLWDANAANQTTATATNLSGGTYVVTVTDANNCTASISMTISENSAIVTDTSSTPATCLGIFDGTATVTATGGAGGYTFQWDANANNQTTATATSLNVGTYNVTVTDAANCTAVAVAIVTSPPAMTTSITSSMVTSCSYNTDGTATIAASGGAGGYTFQWDANAANQTTATATGLSVQTYFVTVTDVNGCSAIDSAVIGGPTPLVSVPSFTTVSCNGFSDGTATVAVSGGTGNYNYNWSNLATTPTNTGLVAGDYFVTITDVNNCILLDTVTVTEPDTFQTTAIHTDVSCFGGNDGTGTALPQGGLLPYNYAWNPSGSTDSIAMNLSAGTYNLTITDGGGCTDIASIIVTEPATPLSSTTDSTPLLCNGDASGTATITASGGTIGTGYTYLWDANANNQTTATATALQAGTYSVTVTDSLGCTDIKSIVVTEPVAVSGTMNSFNALCNGSTDGWASITPSGGVGNYNYIWSPSGATDSLATNLGAGFHYVTVTDGNSCIYEDSIEVLEPTAITLQLDSTEVLCNGDSTGSVTVIAAGGSGGFTYLWDANAMDQTTATAINLPIGTYTVTVTDVNLCSVVGSVSVTEPTVLDVTAAGTDISCFGGNDGTVTPTATGGVGTYTFTWSGGQTTNLIAGMYMVTVTDGNGCTDTTSIILTEPATPLTTSMNSTILVCNGDGSGTATVTAAGGTIGTGYTYLWDANANNQTTTTATALQAGTYSVTVTDAKGCIDINSVVVTEPTAIVKTPTSTPTSCFGLSDGSAKITAVGGTGILTYVWSPSGSTLDSVPNLGAGFHYVTVTDANGCTAFDSIEITQPAPILTTMDSTQVVCSGGSDGTATVIATGGAGAGNYTYNWSPSNANTATATNLAIGFHVVTVTDINGCTTKDSILVTEPPVLTLTTDTIDVLCFGESTGQGVVTPIGGVPGYTYAWSTVPVQTDSLAFNLATGNYTVTVTDANGCTETASIFVDQPATPLQITSFNTTQVSCFGGNDGTATANVTGGTGTYNFSWTPTNQNGQVATGLRAGRYTVLVTDANGCFAVDSVIVGEPDSITTNFFNVMASSCYQGNDGSATIAASGGTPNPNNEYTYIWNTIPQQIGTSASGFTATNLVGGQTYTVTIIDNLNCSKTASITIPHPDPVTLTTSQQNVSCFGLSDATATVMAAGGTAPYFYQWDANAGNQTTATAIGLSTGTYFVTVTDTLGCSESTNVTITQPPSLASTTSTVDLLCKGDAVGSGTVLIAGGTMPYWVQWDANTGSQTGSTADSLTAGTYAFLVQDSNGCSLRDSVTITEPDEALTATDATTNTLCHDGRDGVLQITAAGGVPPYQYSLDGVNYTNNDRRVGLVAGSYTYYVKDDNGCTYTDVISIFEPDEFSVDLGSDITIDFEEAVNLSVATTNGATPFTYLWTPIDSTFSCTTCPNPTIDSLSEDAYYTVIVTDNNGCEADDEIIVRVNKPRLVFVANAFTPNLDGNNDFLFVQGGDGTFQVKEFKVFDRWGELVFEQNDAPLNGEADGWNGEFKGKALGAGTYAWFAVVEFKDGKQIVYKGSTLLLR